MFISATPSLVVYLIEEDRQAPGVLAALTEAMYTSTVRHFASVDTAFNAALAAAAPDLVLLNLDLPGQDPVGFLARMRRGQLRQVPVMVMAHGDDQAKVRQCYEAGATVCLPKPSDDAGYLDQFLGVQRWLRVNRLPGNRPAAVLTAS